jgi:uridine phosphorylase
VIDRALRDEGTSYHYAAPSAFAEAEPRLVAVASEALRNKGLNAVIGSSWTTDAPFRETATAIEFARSQGVLAVEMEAAALYTFAQTAGVAVICIAHVTNTMGLAEQDFEKGKRTEPLRRLGCLKRLCRGGFRGEFGAACWARARTRSYHD